MPDVRGPTLESKRGSDEEMMRVDIGLEFRRAPARCELQLWAEACEAVLAKYTEILRDQERHAGAGFESERSIAVRIPGELRFGEEDSRSGSDVGLQAAVRKIR